MLAFDFFMKLMDQKRPQFATCFTIHVASAMHRYWAERFPEDYDELEYGEEWIDRYGPEIDFAMTKFDEAFARLVKFVDRNPETILLVASSMGQRAQFGDMIRTQLYLRRPGEFLAWLGLREDEWKLEAAMEPDVNLFVNASRQEEVERRLSRILIDGKPIQYDFKEAFLSLHFGQANLDDEKDHYLLDGEAQVPFDEVGLVNVQIEDEAGSTAYHCPEGTLLIYDPRAGAQDGTRETVSAVEVAPAILRNFGAPVPSYMSGRDAITF